MRPVRSRVWSCDNACDNTPATPNIKVDNTPRQSRQHPAAPGMTSPHSQKVANTPRGVGYFQFANACTHTMPMHQSVFVAKPLWDRAGLQLAVPETVYRARAVERGTAVCAIAL